MNDFIKWFFIFWGILFLIATAFVWWPAYMIFAGAVVIFAIVYFGFRILFGFIEFVAWMIARTIEAPFRIIAFFWRKVSA